jgi:ABC-type transport system substrate-binding protein
VITFRASVPGSEVQAVLKGQADLFNMLHAPAAVEKEVALARPAQVHRDRFQFTYWIAFDTVRPPFDQRAARRAVAVAVDREHLAELMQQGREQAACGLPPPGFPGYDPSCPFAENVGSTRRWTPDLREARRLVARSGTAGMRVEIYWPSAAEPFAASGRYVTRLLHRIGYDARLHPINHYPPTPAEAAVLNVSSIGWSSDLNTAADYYLPMFACDSPDGNSPGRFCDHRLDALAGRAIRLAESDPGAADRLWRTIFAQLRDDAIVVPMAHGGKSTLLSERVGNYQFGDSVGPLYDQMWVR